jgi:hypothetical protein
VPVASSRLVGVAGLLAVSDRFRARVSVRLKRGREAERVVTYTYFSELIRQRTAQYSIW